MKLKFCSKLTSTLIMLGSVTVPVIASLSYANAQNQPEAPEDRVAPQQTNRELLPSIIVPNTTPIPNMREVSPKRIYPGGEIKGRIVPSTELDITPSQTEQISPQRVASPRSRVATFDQTNRG